MKKRTVVHMIDQLGLGGTEHQLFYLLSRLSAQYEFRVLYYIEETPSYVEDLRRIGIQVELIPRQAGVYGRIKLVQQLARRLRDLEPDIVHTWLISANVWGGLAYVLSGRKGVAIASIRSVVRSFYLADKLAYRFLDGWAHRIVCNTEVARRLILRHRIRQYKVLCVPNGINPTDYDLDLGRDAARLRLGIPNDKLVIGAIGSLTPWKNHKMFVAMAKRLWQRQANVHFVLVGDGELQARIERQVRREGLSAVFTLTGARRDIAQVLQAFDVFVCTSSLEGLPNVIMEAMSARLPVVSTAVGGVPELIEHGVNGLLVPAGDIAALTHHVATLLQDQPERVRLGEAGRQAIEAYSLTRMAERTAEVYEAVARPADAVEGARL